MPPMSAASAYTWSTPWVACSAASHRRRSSSSNSSASTSVYSGYRRSTPRTQYPFSFSRVTRWWPMNPPAPVTQTRSIAAVLPSRMPCSRTHGGCSVGAAVLDDREDGLPDDHGVERERPLLDVAQVETDRLLPVQVRAAADLPQTGEARLHEQPSSCLAVVRLVGDRQRTGADQRHLAAQHVDQLGQLVHRRATQQAPQV